jgi:hypothetical protein
MSLHYSIDTIFSELEARQIDVSVYGRTVERTQSYEVQVSFTLNRGDRTSVSVGGTGPSLRAALNDAYQRLDKVRAALEGETEPGTPAQPVDDENPLLRSPRRAEKHSS